MSLIDSYRELGGYLDFNYNDYSLRQHLKWFT